MFGAVKFDVIGEPEDLGPAVQLAKDDRYQFQWWARYPFPCRRAPSIQAARLHLFRTLTLSTLKTLI